MSRNIRTVYNNLNKEGVPYNNLYYSPIFSIILGDKLNLDEILNLIRDFLKELNKIFIDGRTIIMEPDFMGHCNEYKINEIYNSSRFEWIIYFEEIISSEIKIINKMFKKNNLTKININLFYNKKEKYILQCNRLRGDGSDIFIEMFNKLKKIFNYNNQKIFI
jgi:hypothetical protein